MMSEPSKTFEDSIHRLEEIVQKMESGDLPLEESLKLFEEGTNLVKSSAVFALFGQAALVFLCPSALKNAQNPSKKRGCMPGFYQKRAPIFNEKPPRSFYT